MATPAAPATKVLRCVNTVPAFKRLTVFSKVYHQQFYIKNRVGSPFKPVYRGHGEGCGGEKKKAEVGHADGSGHKGFA